VSFELRFVIVTFAAFAWAGLAGAAVAVWWSRKPIGGAAVARASRVLCIRLLPPALAFSAAALAATAFAWFEPREAVESFGWVLSLLAAGGAALLVSTVVRAIAVAVSTRRLWRQWMATAEPIAVAGIDVPAYAVNTSFPVVAVVGFWRPRLVIARTVLGACTADELRAILRHERHHLERRDNLQRALLALSPDVLGLLPASRRLLRSWHEAAEDAADDFARRDADTTGVALAAALVKVARLAPSGTFAATLPASALYRGENLERRVRRLLQPATDAPVDRLARTILAIGAILVGTALLQLDRLHTAMETAVNLLP
jgi:Zn-dependent protease with chaperone function